MFTQERPVGTHRSNNERRRDDGSRHVVRVLPDRPGVEDERREALQVEHAVLAQAVADRMLHERVHDEK